MKNIQTRRVWLTYKNSSQIIEKLDQGSKIELLDEYAKDKYLHIRYRNENGEVVDGYVWGGFVDINDEGELLWE